MSPNIMLKDGVALSVCQTVENVASVRMIKFDIMDMTLLALFPELKKGGKKGNSRENRT